jgi:hypothetical protein
MSHDQTAELSAFKEAVAAEIKPLLSSLQDPEDRFYAHMAILRDAWDQKLADDAFTTAKQITDTATKVQALQTLMTEADYREHEVSSSANTES